MSVGRRYFMRGLLAALVAGRAVPAHAGDSLDGLRKHFARLRKRRAQDAHDPRVYSWGGEMHEVMIKLAKRLGVAGTPMARVREIMGEPEERTAERWIYEWRGRHDYLYFVIENDRVARTEWYWAGE